MTPADLRAARKKLGMSQHGLAEALRMGKSGWQSVSRWERDGSAVPGAAAVAIEGFWWRALVSDPALIAAYHACDAEPGDPWLDALTAEIERRNLDL